MRAPSVSIDLPIEQIIQSWIVRTLTLEQAAEFLNTTPETVSFKIKHEGLPAAKVGRAWVLVDEDIIGWLRRQYRAQGEECGSTRENRTELGLGGFPSLTAASRLEKQLARKTSKRHGSTPTGIAALSGELPDSTNVRRLCGT